MLNRLSVFRGGWTLEAAESVVTGEDPPKGEVLDLLDRLVRQSLVLADRSPGHSRYRLLETLRQYADDKLDKAGEKEDLRRRHAEYYLALAEQAEMGMRGRDQATWTAIFFG